MIDLPAVWWCNPTNILGVPYRYYFFLSFDLIKNFFAHFAIIYHREEATHRVQFDQTWNETLIDDKTECELSHVCNYHARLIVGRIGVTTNALSIPINCHNSCKSTKRAISWKMNYWLFLNRLFTFKCLCCL